MKKERKAIKKNDAGILIAVIAIAILIVIAIIVILGVMKQNPEKTPSETTEDGNIEGIDTKEIISSNLNISFYQIYSTIGTRTKEAAPNYTQIEMIYGGYYDREIEKCGVAGNISFDSISADSIARTNWKDYELKIFTGQIYLQEGNKIIKRDLGEDDWNQNDIYFNYLKLLDDCTTALENESSTDYPKYILLYPKNLSRILDILNINSEFSSLKSKIPMEDLDKAITDISIRYRINNELLIEKVEISYKMDALKTNVSAITDIFGHQRPTSKKFKMQTLDSKSPGGFFKGMF